MKITLGLRSLSHLIQFFFQPILCKANYSQFKLNLPPLFCGVQTKKATLPYQSWIDVKNRKLNGTVTITITKCHRREKRLSADRFKFKFLRAELLQLYFHGYWLCSPLHQLQLVMLQCSQSLHVTHTAQDENISA